MKDIKEVNGLFSCPYTGCVRSFDKKQAAVMHVQRTHTKVTINPPIYGPRKKKIQAKSLIQRAYRARMKAQLTPSGRVAQIGVGVGRGKYKRSNGASLKNEEIKQSKFCKYCPVCGSYLEAVHAGLNIA